MKKTKEQLRQMNFIDKLYGIIQKCLQLLCGVYLFAILAVMPLYFTDGYARIGTNKYEFFEMVTDFGGSAFVALFLLWAVLRMLRKESWKMVLSPLDIAVGAYGVCVLISYLLSAYHEPTPYGDVWSGAKGWYMGAKTQLSFVGSYFVISRFAPRGKRLAYLLASALPVNFVIFLLGYLNRFGIRPIEMKAANPSFISTIGNMNWYCGYAVIILFAVIGYVWASGKTMSIWWMVYLLVGFGTLLTQGSVSGLVTLMALMFVLYLFSAKNGEDMTQFGILLILLGATMTFTWGVRILFPKAMNFTDGIIDIFTYSPVTIIVLIMGSVLLWLMKKKKGSDKSGQYISYMRTGGYALGIVIVVGFVVYIMLLVTNTLHPGIIGPLSENPLFTFDGNYGSSRGATWMAACGVFAEQDFIHKLIGVGPDGMAMYLYTDASEILLAGVREVFEKQTLTNAHCEILNVLVNVGILGAVSFVAILVCVFQVLHQELTIKGEKNALIIALCFGVLAYATNNLFSFQQAMNGATLYVVLGLLGVRLREV